MSSQSDRTIAKEPDDMISPLTLLPCPFCGGDAKIVTWKLLPWFGPHQYRGQCIICGVWAPGDGKSTRAEAAIAWNRRAK